METICLEPDYAADFRCDGRRCGSLCCGHWGIWLDEAAYRRYSALPQPLRGQVLAHVRQEAESGGQRYILDFPPESVCPFLREDKLCRLQRELGEDYLSDACAIYPRRLTQLGPYRQRFLDLSCPLVAELALLRTEQGELVERELPQTRAGGWQHLATGEEELGLAESLHCLQLAGLALLKNRARSLPERLGALLACLRQADEIAEQGEIAALFRLADRCQTEGWLPSEPFAERDSVWLGELRLTLAPIEAANRHVRAIRPLQTGRRLPPLEVLRENFLTALFCQGLYPCRLAGSLLHNGLVLAAIDSLLAEAAEAACRAGDAPAAISVCVRFATLAEHDQDWLDALSDYMAGAADRL